MATHRDAQYYRTYRKIKDCYNRYVEACCEHTDCNAFSASQSPTTGHRQVQSSERDDEMPPWARAILKTMATVNVRLMEIERMVGILVRRSSDSASECFEESLPEGLSFPLNTMEELNRAEQLLRVPATEKALLYLLKTEGGSTVKEATNNILLRIFGPKNLAEKLCWSGSKDKREFKSLRLRTVVCKAVRQNPQTRDTTDAEVKRVAQDFFRNARDRCGGRQNRMRVETVES